MSAHTPGPWRINSRKPHGHYVTTTGGLTVCSVTYMLPEMVGGRVVEARRIANANLIAAAPEMLEALENLENDDGAIPEHAWTIVQDAIAKARGA